LVNFQILSKLDFMNNEFKISSYKEKTFKVRIQSFLMDLPAKASVLNVKQFNGEFGCITCDHPGEGSKEARKWIYPYTTKVSSYPRCF